MHAGCRDVECARLQGRDSLRNQLFAAIDEAGFLGAIEQRAARNQLLREMRQPGRFESALRLLFYVIRARVRDGRRKAVPVRQVPVSDQGPRTRW